MILKMNGTQVVDNSHIQGYPHLDDHIPLTFKGNNLLGNNLVLTEFFPSEPVPAGFDLNLCCWNPSDPLLLNSQISLPIMVRNRGNIALTFDIVVHVRWTLALRSDNQNLQAQKSWNWQHS